MAYLLKRSNVMQKHFQKSLDSIQKSTLYMVATPIGNLADITLRALAILQRVDWIYAEDTRVSAHLLSAYGISTKLINLREHNEQHMADKIIEQLAQGYSVAQISDAGTPAICDPGAKLAQRVHQAGFPVVPIVGASALIGALSVAGISEPHFYFHGFLPPKSSERNQLFTRWQTAHYPIVAFETPHRIIHTLTDLTQTLPTRHLMLAREITKTFETFLFGTAKELQQKLIQDPNQTRGEMVLVIHPAPPMIRSELSDEAQNIMRILAQQLPTKQAADLTAKITQANKKTLYDWAIKHI